MRNINASDSLPVERALGIYWNIELDIYTFRITLRDIPLCRRSMLATVTSIFSPRGLVAPFLLPGRRIVQTLCKDKGSWDDDVPDELRMLWAQWRANILKLEELKVSRCYKPKGFVAVKSELHCFSDASDYGYGQATYLRQVSQQGEIAVALVMGKSRVVPSKSTTTIVRSELTAATVSTSIAALVRQELDISDLKVTYWVDSNVVLGYIRNDCRRYRTYVGNRKRKINAYTPKKAWKRVKSSENPADVASRGVSPDEQGKVDLWFNSAPFLHLPEESWETIDLPAVDANDPEVIHEASLAVNTTNVQEDQSLLERLECRISRWLRMTRVVGWMRKYIQRYVMKLPVEADLDVEDVIQAEMAVVRMIQGRHFKIEGREIGKVSRQLSSLDPYTDSSGVLRVGGRLRNAEEDENLKHPIILPNNCTAVTRLVEWHHQRLHHLGRTTTVNDLRSEGFWLISYNAQVRKVIHKCVPCRRKRGKLQEQKMSDHPISRLCTEGPFVHCGLDMFGHVMIKERRREEKRWVILFTCLSCRGIHLETVTAMDTDSFLLALRRFLARRGPVRSILSDNGGNFVGASNELRNAYMEMDHERIKSTLLTQLCEWIDWKRNPPHSSHKGGVWERQIRTARSVLSSILTSHANRLNDESLRTLMAEVEAIVNSRPLAVESLGDEELAAITPNHILTMKSKVVLSPPGTFTEADIYCKRRWRAVQYMADEFWKRWRREYLSTIQARQKWKEVKRNVQVNDVVLLKEQDLRRNQWPLGRVVETFKGDDGLVRTVRVKIANAVEPLVRSIVKVVVLVESEEVEGRQ